MAGTARSGIGIILPSLLTAGLLKTLPDGKTVPMSPGMETYPRENMDWYRETLTGLFAAGAAGELEPVVAKRIPFARAAEAHQFFESGGHAGKVVLVAGE